MTFDKAWSCRRAIAGPGRPGRCAHGAGAPTPGKAGSLSSDTSVGSRGGDGRGAIRVAGDGDARLAVCQGRGCCARCGERRREHNAERRERVGGVTRRRSITTLPGRAVSWTTTARATMRCGGRWNRCPTNRRPRGVHRRDAPLRRVAVHRPRRSGRPGALGGHVGWGRGSAWRHGRRVPGPRHRARARCRPQDPAADLLAHAGAPGAVDPEARALAALNHPNIGAIYGLEGRGRRARWYSSSSRARRSMTGREQARRGPRRTPSPRPRRRAAGRRCPGSCP